ncbi:MAG: LytR C-terminal domain-containing protein [Gemmatimonadota bacterium]
MAGPTRIIGLVVVGLVVVAFGISFVRGLGDDATPVTMPGVERPVPGLDSGRRVEVLNAAGRSGMARTATDRLRVAGYDVVFFGNAGNRKDSLSIVLDRVGKPDLARAVASHLGITRVETAIDSTRLVEVSVVLGVDWPVKN